MSQEIKDALMKLDVKDDSLWTSDGAPRVNVLGIPDLKRADILAAAPQFSRENPTVEIGKIDSKGEYLLGSDVQPATFYLKDGTEISLGDVVAAAFDSSGLSIDEWNTQDREAEIQAYVDTLDILYEDEIVVPKESQGLSLEAQKEQAAKELAMATKIKEAALKVEDEARHKYDLAVDAIEKSTGTTTNQEEIMRYMRSQNDLRLKRAEKFKQVTALGIDLNNVGPAPIDKAMMRRNTRGTKRPARAMINDKADK